jgi:hypothetical protein
MDDQVQLELAHLIRISWIVLIPVGVLLAMVLYKLAMLLHGVLEFLNLARYELAPAMKDLRHAAEHVEFLSGKAADSVRSLEHGVEVTRPAIVSGINRIRDGAAGIKTRVGSLFSGLRRSFIQPK